MYVQRNEMVQHLIEALERGNRDEIDAIEEKLRKFEKEYIEAHSQALKALDEYGSFLCGEITEREYLN